MDEYKYNLYNRRPLDYAEVDAGDISEPKALRERLKCKPFKWFMENLLFDLEEHYPMEEPSFAYGGIRNVGEDLCVDTMGREEKDQAPLELYPCAKNISFPQSTQSFSLTLNYDIRLRFGIRCWSKETTNAIWLRYCDKNTKRFDDRVWRYDLVRGFRSILFCYLHSWF